MKRKPICENTLAMMYETGEPLELIAEHFGRGKPCISNHAKRLGLSHPNAPNRKGKYAYERFARLRLIERYENGESLKALARKAKSDCRIVREYLTNNGVRIRSRLEQIEITMKTQGTIFVDRRVYQRDDSRLYVSERDKYGLVTKTWVYRNGSKYRQLVYSRDD